VDASTETQRRTRPLDGKAVASPVLAVAAVLTVDLWFVATILAIAAISFALASRRSLRADPELRGTTLGLVGFLISAGVLVVTMGPSLLLLWSMTLASFSG